MTREELVEAVREYANANSPRWDHVVYQVRDQRDRRIEYLLIERDDFTVLTRDEIARSLASPEQAP